MLSRDAWVPLAEVMRPHGVRGEVRVRPFNRDSDLLLDLDEVRVRFPDGSEDDVSVDGARPVNDAILMKLHSVDDPDQADVLRGALICARRADFPALEAGEFYACDIEGAMVVLEEEGGRVREIGRVRTLKSYPSVAVLEVDAGDGGRAWEVPLVDTIVRSVDVEASRVTLLTMEGVERA